MRVFLLISLLITTACQGSSTIGPLVTNDELIREQAAQRQYIKDQAVPEYKTPPKITDQMVRRFKRIAARVGVAGEELCKDVSKQVDQDDCIYGFKLNEEKILNAFADGDNVIITSAMMKFAANDSELANILSHEYAHNIMSHVAKTQQNVGIGSMLGAVIDVGLQSQGIVTGGVLGQVGAQAGLLNYSVDFEREADYIGMYIMASSGYDLKYAPEFWRRMSIANEKGIDTAVTHPTNAERFVALNKTINEINSKKKAGLPLLPEFRTSK